MRSAVSGFVKFPASNEQCGHDGDGNEKADQVEVTRIMKHLLGVGREVGYVHFFEYCANAGLIGRTRRCENGIDAGQKLAGDGQRITPAFKE